MLAANQATTFPTTDTKLFVIVVTLLTDDNGKLLQQLKSGFKLTGINISKKQQHRTCKSIFRLLK